MITREIAFKTESGIYATLEGAQHAALKELFKGVDASEADKTGWAGCIVANKEKILDILTTTPTSKPKARAINGGRKKRKVEPSPELSKALKDLAV